MNLTIFLNDVICLLQSSISLLSEKEWHWYLDLFNYSINACLNYISNFLQNQSTKRIAMFVHVLSLFLLNTKEWVTYHCKESTTVILTEKNLNYQHFNALLILLKIFTIGYRRKIASDSGKIATIVHVKIKTQYSSSQEVKCNWFCVCVCGDWDLGR